VTDTAVTGYMWGENIGWIKLNPANGGVFNDGVGNLSGYAWGENVGWIKFAHAYGGVYINPGTGVFSGYAWGENIGWINFGPTGRAAITSWRPPNLPPVASDQSVTTDEDTPVGITLTATDPEGNPLTFSVVSTPSHGTLSGSAPDVSYSPNANYNGPDSFTFKANDGLADSNVATVNITVNPVNDPPALTPIGNKTINEGELLGFTITATDPDGDTLAYSAGNLPTGATFDSGTGKFSWTPDYTQAGNYNVLFTVTDNGTPPLSASETITITVGNVNRPPVLDPIGNKTVNEGQVLTIKITATDPDGDTLTYSASNLPSGATFDPVSQTFTWVPNYDQAGNYSVRFTVTDNVTSPESDTEEIIITVGNVNRPPVLAPIGNKTVIEGEFLEFTITATDPDGDALTYSADNLPPGATFDPGTQKFSWTPSYDQAGTYSNIVFTVTDNGSPTELDFEVIIITVGNVNRAPVFTPVGTQSILENQLLQFYVTAADPDGNAITYSTGSLPNGASFDASTKLFSWRPDGTEAGTYTIVFYASDNGSPSMTGQLEVAIIVGNVPTPCELSDRIIQTVIGLHLRKSVENSYMANLKKVCQFIQDGKIFQAIIQLDVFIAKVVIDVVQGDISKTAGTNLINMAIDLIKLLRS
jgi:hypothetical protein